MLVCMLVVTGLSMRPGLEKVYLMLISERGTGAKGMWEQFRISDNKLTL